MSKTLRNKVVLLIGGNKIGGASLAASLAERGANVAVVCFDDEHHRISQIQRGVESNGQRCLIVAADPDSDSFPDQVIGCVVKEFGRLDIFIDYAPLPQIDPDADSERPQVDPMANPFSNSEMMAAALRQIVGDRNNHPD